MTPEEYEWRNSPSAPGADLEQELSDTYARAAQREDDFYAELALRWTTQSFGGFAPDGE